jgi:predicted SprT family Zn-dependent metalloprotease
MKHGRGHGSNWKSIAKQIGCDGNRCYDGETVNLPKAKYILTCDNCGYESPKHRKVTKQYACGKCCNKYNGGKFSKDYLLRFVVNNLELSK